MEAITLTITETNKIIRKELKNKFPNTKFAVTKGHGNTSAINWINGPEKQKIRAFIKFYEAMTFDPMDDSHNYQSQIIKGVKVTFGTDSIFLYR